MLYVYENVIVTPQRVAHLSPKPGIDCKNFTPTRAFVLYTVSART